MNAEPQMFFASAATGPILHSVFSLGVDLAEYLDVDGKRYFSQRF
jgi:hypothetical protein